MKSTILLSLFLSFFTLKAFEQSSKYLNQPSPGLTPKIFAPGLVSLKEHYEFGSVFSKDCLGFYYGVNVGERAEIRYIQFKNNEVTKPAIVISHDKYSYNDPFLSPDETQLFFISDMPLNGTGEKKDYDIWYIQKTGNTWSKPINAGSNINTAKNEYYVSFSKKGTLYFSSNSKTTEENKGNYDLYSSIMKNRSFQPAVRLSDSINTKNYEADVFIAYDESYIIFCGDRPGGYGRGDLYISFKRKDGAWMNAKNMGNVINTAGHELCPFVSKDGKYFFYTSNKDIFWVDAKVIHQLAD